MTILILTAGSDINSRYYCYYCRLLYTTTIAATADAITAARDSSIHVKSIKFIDNLIFCPLIKMQSSLENLKQSPAPNSILY